MAPMLFVLTKQCDIDHPWLHSCVSPQSLMMRTPIPAPVGKPAELKKDLVPKVVPHWFEQKRKVHCSRSIFSDEQQIKIRIQESSSFLTSNIILVCVI